jgi:hypothetical protein
MVCINGDFAPAVMMSFVTPIAKKTPLKKILVLSCHGRNARNVRVNHQIPAPDSVAKTSAHMSSGWKQTVDNYRAFPAART